MKKMQCEVCGSTEIKKVSDGIFECQSCGVQYNTAEVKKLLVEVTGKVKIDHSEEVENNIKRAAQYEEAGNDAKAAEYYNAALDMDADNKVAQKRVKEIADQQELEDYYIIEPDVDPQENVRQFLEQLAATQNIACDIYKEIAIKSVTEKYMTFYFMKAKYQVDWTATACHIYYENQTVYKERYDSTLKRRVKEPVTEKVQRVNRVPQSGTHIFNSEELVLASESLGKHFTVETDTAKRALLSAFETQQDSKYSTYNTQKINPRDVQKEDGKFLYKGFVLDAQIDKRIYSDRKKKMADTASERAAPEITNSIGGDYYENLNATRYTLSESVAYVCIPVQIIEYTYKGKNYAALSDLLSYTTTMPLIYPCDTELATAMGRLETQKQSAQKAPGMKAGLVIMGIGLVCLLIGMLPGLAEIFIPLMLVLDVVGLILLLVSFIIQRSRKKKFKSSASDIKRTLFDPRVSALETTKKQFFEEYTDYASAQNAAANADCLAIKQTSPELGDAGAIRKKMAFVTNDVDSDDTITALEDGIKQIQKKRTIGILSGLLIGALLGVLGIVCLSEMRYLHTIASCILWATTIGGFGFAFFGSIVIMGNMNKRINDLRAAIAAHKLRKQLSEEFENPQERPESMSNQLSVWTEERITETIEQLTKQADKRIPPKQRLRDWIKKHKILLAITSGIVLLVLLAIAIESIICSVQAKPYEQGLIGRIFEYQRIDYRGDLDTYTYRFGENGKVEYSSITIDSNTSKTSYSYQRSEKYQIHYNIFTGEVTLVLDGSPCEVKCISGSTNISSFEQWGSTYYEITDSEDTSNGGNASQPPATQPPAT